MSKVLYPHRWFVWTIVISVLTALALLWAIELYRIDIAYQRDSFDAQFLDTFNRLHGQRAEMSNSQTVYRNDQYGFLFILPKSWKGYTVVPGTREIRDVASGDVVATIPTLRIRHPEWTAQNPYEDAPVNVYTLAQWSKIQDGTYSAGAAPIPPSELGRNNAYVFGLPARYNYDYSTGWEEVEQIFVGEPLKAFDVIIDFSLLHSSCKTTGACEAPFQCVSYYGIAGPQIPVFKTCEIQCGTQSDCPTGLTCAVIADGPGRVCTK